MNYYDLSHPSTPPTRGYRLGLWRLRRQRIFQILVALAGILTYLLLYMTFKREDYTNEMLKPCVLLFFSVVVFLVLLLFARNRIDIVRMKNGKCRSGMITITPCIVPYIKRMKNCVPSHCYRWQDSRSNCTVRRWRYRHWNL